MINCVVGKLSCNLGFGYCFGMWCHSTSSDSAKNSTKHNCYDNTSRVFSSIKIFDVIPSKPSSKVKGIGVKENQASHYSCETKCSLDISLGTQLFTSVEIFLVVPFLKFFLSISVDNFDGLESLLSIASTLTVSLKTFSESRLQGRSHQHAEK